MHEILRNLRPGARVLDLGALTGSFPAACCPRALIVRLDLEKPASGDRLGFVQGDASRLPFSGHSFDAVIANHSLEHISPLKEALREIGRVTIPDGSLFVAVPDASTFSDRLFRWIYRGSSGHVNPFCSASDLAVEITRATRLPLRAQRPLYSSFEYLNRYYFGPQTSWRLRLLGNGHRKFIVLLSYATRLFDRIFNARTSAYGWAFYFGQVGENVETAAWSNVCVGCGAAHSAVLLQVQNLVERRFLFKYYHCPDCGSFNLFTLDP